MPTAVAAMAPDDILLDSFTTFFKDDGIVFVVGKYTVPYELPVLVVLVPSLEEAEVAVSLDDSRK